MIQLPGMLMIGAQSRNLGKTELACKLLRYFSRHAEIIGIKATTIGSQNRKCSRNKSGCGACSISGDFEIHEETIYDSAKDTTRLLAAGAHRVFWLRAYKHSLREGLTALLKMAGRNSIFICESNSLRRVAEPGVFLMLADSLPCLVKPSAAAVTQYADAVIISDGKHFDLDFSDIRLEGGKWGIRADAAAIILAGGQSARMGQDKSMLLVDGVPMIEHIYYQLRPHFRQILISANDPEKYRFLDTQVIPDRITGQGPLMGVASALEFSSSDLNFVTACDVPQMDISFINRMLRQSPEYDIVVPVKNNRPEPLYGVYKKNLAAAFFNALNSGIRKITEAYSDRRIKYIESVEELPLNLNTMADYNTFINNE